MTINIRRLKKIYKKASNLSFLFRNIGNKFWWSEREILWRLYVRNNGQNRFAVVVPYLTEKNEILFHITTSNSAVSSVVFGSIFPKRTLKNALNLAKMNLVTELLPLNGCQGVGFTLTETGRIYCQMEWG